MKIYNKLVRDNIINIISNSNKKAKYHILTDDDYLTELNNKLVEELNEYLESNEIEELADIQEIINALVVLKGYTFDKFDEIRENKAIKNGKFEKKIFLESVEENE